MMVIVVNTVLRYLNNHFITLWPSSWSWASNSGGVQELNEGLLWRELESLWGESALEVLWVGMVGEFVTHEVNVLTTFNGSHIWVETSHGWLIKVSESEVSVGPINTVEGDLEVELGVGVWSGW